LERIVDTLNDDVEAAYIGTDRLVLKPSQRARIDDQAAAR
jgi:hypothetical protein